VRAGFGLLPKLNSQQLTDIVDYVISNISKRTRYDPDVAAGISGIDKAMVGDLLSAVALTVGAVFDIEATTDDFFKVAPSGLVPDQSVAIVRIILDRAIAQRLQIKADIETSRLANAILPSFRSIDYNVDVRLDFDEDDNIKNRVPLVIFYIGTDLEEEITFQASASDIDELMRAIEAAKRRMEKGVA
jgi:hypothetical protein